jgi:hypothetical protein
MEGAIGKIYSLHFLFSNIPAKNLKKLLPTVSRATVIPAPLLHPYATDSEHS